MYIYMHFFKNNYKRQTILLVSQGLKLTLCATEATLVVIFGKKEKRKKGRSKKKKESKKRRRKRKAKKEEKAWVKKNNNNNERWYKVPWWVKGNPFKIRRILLGWEPRRKLGIIPKEEENFKQRSFLPSYERYPNHWGFPLRSSPSGYLSLDHKPPCTSRGPHNMTFGPRSTLQEHISKRHEESMNVASHLWEWPTRKSVQKPS